MKKSLAGNIFAAAVSFGLLATLTAAHAQDSDSRRAATSRAFGTCDGFAQEAVVSNTENSQRTTTSSGFVEMPSTRLQGGGSGGGIDLYTVTFSGEAAASSGSWEIQAQFSTNGGSTFFNMNPNQPNTFHSGSARQTHTMTWCQEIDASSTIFRIVWRKNAGGTAFIDDYLMRVERSS